MKLLPTIKFGDNIIEPEDERSGVLVVLLLLAVFTIFGARACGADEYTPQDAHAEHVDDAAH